MLTLVYTTMFANVCHVVIILYLYIESDVHIKWIRLNFLQNLSKTPILQRRSYDFHSVYISKDRTVSYCIRHWPRDGMSGISPVDSRKSEL